MLIAHGALSSLLPNQKDPQSIVQRAQCKPNGKYGSDRNKGLLATSIAWAWIFLKLLFK